MSTETFLWIVCPGLATGVGGLALLGFPRPAHRALDGLLGFTAGVMLAAAAFSLLVPALDDGGIGEVVLGFGIGFGAMAVLDVAIPHAHARFRERGGPAAEEAATGRRGTMLVSALTIHNVPEGAAVGVAFAAGGTELGIPIALAIAIQNVPEGFAAAAPLLGAGMPRGRAIGVAALTGVVEPPAALAAYGSFELASGLLPLGLAFAAGAMLYVVVDELVPEAQGRGNERLASLGFLVGFSVMMALDNAFG